jgi:hypothetical protein
MSNKPNAYSDGTPIFYVLTARDHNDSVVGTLRYVHCGQQARESREFFAETFGEDPTGEDYMEGLAHHWGNRGTVRYEPEQYLPPWCS